MDAMSSMITNDQEKIPISLNQVQLLNNAYAV